MTPITAFNRYQAICIFFNDIERIRKRMTPPRWDIYDWHKHQADFVKICVVMGIVPDFIKAAFVEGRHYSIKNLKNKYYQCFLGKIQYTPIQSERIVYVEQYKYTPGETISDTLLGFAKIGECNRLCQLVDSNLPYPVEAVIETINHPNVSKYTKSYLLKACPKLDQEFVIENLKKYD